MTLSVCFINNDLANVKSRIKIGLPLVLSSKDWKNIQDWGGGSVEEHIHTTLGLYFHSCCGAGTHAPLVRVARLQNEVCTTDFFRATKFVNF